MRCDVRISLLLFQGVRLQNGGDPAEVMFGIPVVVLALVFFGRCLRK